MVEVSAKEGFTDDRPHQSSIITLHIQFPDINATPRACEGSKFFASDVMKHAVQRDALQLLGIQGWRRIEASFQKELQHHSWEDEWIITTCLKSFHTSRPELFALTNILTEFSRRLHYLGFDTLSSNKFVHVCATTASGEAAEQFHSLMVTQDEG
jgi:hypothetical protein